MEATPPRTRNAAATRSAILASARQAFARRGYEGAGVREIAEGAGVTAMLVNRYFGSKENLFIESVAEAMAETDLLVPDILASSDAGRAMARALIRITTPGETVLQGFEITLRSAASQTAADVGRAQIEQHKVRALAEALKGNNTPQRAALIIALVSGLQIMRQVIGLTALGADQSDVLVDLLAPVLQGLIEA